MELIASLIAKGYSTNPATIVDIGNTLVTESMPTLLNFFVILAVQGVEIEDFGRRFEVGLYLLDDDAREVWRLPEPLQSQIPENSPLPLPCNMITIPVAFLLDRYASFLVCVEIDGELVRRLPMSVRQFQ
jgi:hypothetical protein